MPVARMVSMSAAACPASVPRPRHTLAAVLCLLLAACGGGGGGATETAGLPVTNTPTTPTTPTTPSTPTTPTSPTVLTLNLPRHGLVASDLAVIVAEGDALSESVASYYQAARGVPAANIIRIKLSTASD